MRNLKRNYALIFLIFISSLHINAQVLNSGYSMLGLGKLIDNSYGINKSLGGTGIALQSGKTINYQNPASYIGMVPGSVIIEAGVYGMYNKSVNNQRSTNSGSVNFNYFSFSFYSTDWWAISLGITPYSDIDYSFTTRGEVEGELISFDKLLEGSGGLTRLYVGNSFNIYNELNIGFNLNLLTGPITKTEIVEKNDDFAGYTLQDKRFIMAAYPEFGIQYSRDLKGLTYTLGAVYCPGQDVHGFRTLRLTANGTTTILEEDEEKKDEKIRVPEKLGFGIGVKKGTKFRAGFDYEWQGWSSMAFSQPEVVVSDFNRYSIGMEYTFSNSKRDSWLKRIYYRFGASYNQSYLQLDNSRISSKSVNLGLGIPYDHLSNINLSLEYGEEGTQSKGLMKNEYWMFYVSLSLHELFNSVFRE